MLIGEQKHQLDTKNRIRIPSNFKAKLEGKLVMCLGVTQAISVYSITDFERLFSEYAEQSKFDEAKQNSFSIFAGSIFEVVEDNQGRILLPEELRGYCEMKKDLVSVGMIDHIEIWAHEIRAEQKSKVSFKQALETLNKSNKQ